MSIQSSTPITPPGRARTLVTGLLLVALALGAVSGCAKTNKSNAGKANQGLSNVDGSGSPGATPGAGPSGSGGADGSGGASTSASPSAQPSTKTSTKSGPQIVVFKATQLPLCAIPGTVDAPFHQDARDIIIAWQVTGATGVELYMDGGLYGTYGPTGTQQLFFSCETKPEQTHEYKLVTTGGAGSPASRSLKITATNNPPT